MKYPQKIIDIENQLNTAAHNAQVVQDEQAEERAFIKVRLAELNKKLKVVLEAKTQLTNLLREELSKTIGPWITLESEPGPFPAARLDFRVPPCHAPKLCNTRLPDGRPHCTMVA